MSGEFDAIFIGAPSYYVVNKESQSLAAVYDFLNYMAMDPQGHDYMVKRAHMVPAFSNTTLEPDSPLSAAVAAWNRKENGAYTWLFPKMPEGFGMGILGPIYAAFAQGDIDKQGFIDQISARIAELK